MNIIVSEIENGVALYGFFRYNIQRDRIEEEQNMAMVVNDVTLAAHTVLQTDNKKEKETKSSITPFRKILDKEEKNLAWQADKSSGAAQTAKSANTDTISKSASSAKSGTAQLKDIFQRAAEKYDISYDFLVAVAKAESDFNPKCVSSAGAQGIMQVMPEEQKGLGIKDPFDAEQNIMGAAKLLKAHLKKFNGDYTLAAAAYNAGSGRVQKYGGVPPFKETQNYVKKIQKFMKEGVTVPDKKVKTSAVGTAKESSSAVEKESTAESEKAVATGVAATQADFDKITVAVGTGDSAVTMSYGAYLKYLEVGSTGVG